MYIEESIWGYAIMIVMMYALDFYTRKMRKQQNLFNNNKKGVIE